MNDNAKKWVEALRSGEYKQAQRYMGVIKDGEKSYCCLGVACDLYIKSGGRGVTEDTLMREEGAVEAITFNALTGSRMPGAVVEWLGMYHCQQSYLAQLNDSGHSFDSIASYIETRTDLFRDESPYAGSQL